MNQERKKIVIVLVVLLVLCVSIGYASLSDVFKISGTTNITGNTWALSFNNIQVDTATSNVTASVNPHIVTGTSSDTFTQQVEYTITLAKPQDIYVFTVDLVNSGSVDAEIASVNVSGLDANSAHYIDYTVTDVTDSSNPDDPAVGDVIVGSGGTRTYEIATSYLDVDNSVLETYAASSTTLTLTFEVTLVQHIS